jgi:hypothetical protein
MDLNGFAEGGDPRCLAPTRNLISLMQGKKSSWNSES